MTTSYPLQLTALAVAGYVFESEAAVALYVNFLERGDTTRQRRRPSPAREPAADDRGRDGLVPIAEDWRLSGSIYGDVLLSVVRAERAGGRRGDAVAGPRLAVTRLRRFDPGARSLMLPRRDRHSFVA